jgi:hypothetical protein
VDCKEEVAVAFGYGSQSQEFYTRIGSIQGSLTVLSAEVEEIGESIWDLVSGQAGSSVSFMRFQETKDAILDAFRKLIVTQSDIPVESDIAAAEVLTAKVKAMVEFAKRVAPEVAAAVSAKGAAVQAQVNATPLVSPSDVGWDEFEKQMKNRAKDLLPSISTTAIVAVIAGLAGLLYFMKRR